MHALIVADRPECLRPLCGVAIVVRLARTLRRAGADTVSVLSLLDEEGTARLRRLLDDAEVHAPGPDGPARREHVARAWPGSRERVLLVRGDLSLDRRLAARALGLERPGALVDSGPPLSLAPLVLDRVPATDRGLLCGTAVVDRGWIQARRRGGGTGAGLEAEIAAAVESGRLAAVDVADEPGYTTRLRRFLRPWWFPAPSPGQERRARRLLVDATQKGHPDLPAWVHRPFENVLVRLLAPTFVTPNQVTLLTTVVAWCATFLFATGRLAPGILVALVVNVLDGVDGKLARLKRQETAFGRLEHWLDAAFEVSWWAALAFHLQVSGQLPWAWAAALLLGVSEAIDGWAKVQVLRRCGHTIDELGPWERFVRLWGGRRNVYVWIMAVGVFLGDPATAYAVLPAWEGLTAVLHVISVRRLLRSPRRASRAVSAASGSER